jgi:hypothetical protein
MATMKSPGLPISFRANNLDERLAIVMQASRAIRSELALTICESSEMRLASRQLRSVQSTHWSADRRQDLHAGRVDSSHWMAQVVAQVLSSHGYSAFVAGPAEDTASIQ